MVTSADFRLLVDLLGAKFLLALGLQLVGGLERRLAEEALEEFLVVEALGVALQERDGRQPGLCGVQGRGFLELQGRGHEVRVARIDDHDALAGLENRHEKERFGHRHADADDGHQKPQEGSAVFVDEDFRGVE